VRNDTAAPAGELSLRDAVPLVGVTSPSLVVAMATMPRPTPGNPPGSYCPVSGTSQVAIRNVCADFGAELREFNSETGHVHLLVRYPPRVALSRLVGSLKSVSARRLRQEFPGHIRKYLRGEHFWSPSYFATSCGGAPLAIIKHGITPSRHQ
jgi:REP-associated tyrosine transposase